MRNETLLLADFFRHFCRKTTADIRHDLSVNSEFHPLQLMWQLNMENHFSHRRCREGGNPILFIAADSDGRLLNYSFLVAGSIQARRSPMACRAFDGMRSLADEAVLGMATNFAGNQRDC
jgi:hypothetical protein